MRVGGQSVNEAALEQSLGTPLDLAPPEPEQRVPVELQQRAGAHPVCRHRRVFLQQLVALGVGDDRLQAAGSQRKDRLIDRRGDDRHRHLEKNSARSTECRQLVVGRGHPSRRKVHFGAGEYFEPDAGGA